MAAAAPLCSPVQGHRPATTHRVWGWSFRHRPPRQGRQSKVRSSRRPSSCLRSCTTASGCTPRPWGSSSTSCCARRSASTFSPTMRRRVSIPLRRHRSPTLLLRSRSQRLPSHGRMPVCAVCVVDSRNWSCAWPAAQELSARTCGPTGFVTTRAGSACDGDKPGHPWRAGLRRGERRAKGQARCLPLGVVRAHEHPPVAELHEPLPAGRITARRHFGRERH